MNASQLRSRLLKILLLGVFLGLLAAFFSWKAGYGKFGNVAPLDFNSAEYVLFLRQGQDGQTNLFAVKSDGTDERQLTNDKMAKHEPSWSTDGKSICFSGEVKDEGAVAYQVFLLGKDGSRQITRGTGSKQLPLFRPGNKEIAYIVGGAVKVMATNGEHGEQLYPPEAPARYPISMGSGWQLYRGYPGHGGGRRRRAGAV
jgi:hypothetical protein